MWKARSKTELVLCVLWKDMAQERQITYGLVGLCKDFGFCSERNGKPLEPYTHI